MHRARNVSSVGFLSSQCFERHHAPAKTDDNTLHYYGAVPTVMVDSGKLTYVQSKKKF